MPPPLSSTLIHIFSRIATGEKMSGLEKSVKRLFWLKPFWQTDAPYET